MSECHYWWRTGEVQWCDMKGDGCHCGGWDEYCDMKQSGRRSLDLESELAGEEVTLASKRKAKPRHRAA